MPTVMTPSQHNMLEARVPTRASAAAFRVKSFLLKVRRLFNDIFVSRVRRFARSSSVSTGSVIGESRSPLWAEASEQERPLVAGKIQNLRLAAAALDGVEVPAGETFSFWKHVGRTSRFRGFVEGRELREGCIIPNIGGGLCQLSNALYDAALKSNFEIVERHAHTQIIPGSLAEHGRDATVFWNYVDLRFRSPNAFRISARLDPEGLTVQFCGERVRKTDLHQISRTAVNGSSPNSCATCGAECHRALPVRHEARFGRTAFLVDEFWPEFDRYITLSRGANDVLFVPVDGQHYKKANYAWTTGGFGRVEQNRYLTLARSLRSRRLAAQGAARQLNLLATYRSFAENCARRLRWDTIHVVVQQNLLPFLWQTGQLGGRTFDVLMTAMPMEHLQARLDLARGLHQESTTLGDFRADPRLVEAETEALNHARRIVTPHSEIAELFGDRAVKLEWERPDPLPSRHRSARDRPTVLLPSSTMGRKGCYELREALRGLDVRLITLGPDIEGDGFWDGFDVERGTHSDLDEADVVVLPAFVEHRPRLLLRAAALGIPVIASSACGLAGVEGVQTVDIGDPIALRRLIEVSVTAPQRDLRMA